MHMHNEEYIEAIEAIKDTKAWSNNSVLLNAMALAEERLHNYELAYKYYILADEPLKAQTVLKKAPKTELEEAYKDHISQSVKILSRKVLAVEDISSRHEVCRIPLHLCTGGTKKELVEYVSQNNIHSRSLPKRGTFPVMWAPTTCDEIGVSPMRLILEEQIVDWKKDTMDFFLRSLVTSRIFADKNKEYLVPFADMLDHSNTPNVEWAFTDDSFVMTTVKPIKMNEELLDNYGPKSNWETFVHYGFVQPNNTKLDVVRLVGEIPANRLDPRYFKSAVEFELRGSYMEGTVEIFSFLRYVRSNEKQCPQTLKGYYHKPISKENEIWVCKMLYNILQTEVRRRIENSRFTKEPLAVALLQSEMRVLVHWGETLTMALDIMGNKNKKRAKKSKNDYIVKVIKNKGYY